MGFVFKAAFLLSFFSFLRISNLVPHSIASYDYLKQLARGDILFAHPGAHLIIKWSKTLQDNNKVKVIKIPSLHHSILCLVSALKFLLKSTPGSKNVPLFQIKCFSSWVPLTDTRLRKNLSKILNSLNLHHKNITFHSFRHSCATLDFNSNIPIQHIKSHGTWTSDAVWSYITQDHNASDADDTQIYLAVDSRNFDSSMEELTKCLKSVQEWMDGVKLKLNPEKKNEFIIIGQKAIRESLAPNFPVPLLQNNISPLVEVKNLGVIFDSDNSFDNYVAKVC